MSSSSPAGVASGSARSRAGEPGTANHEPSPVSQSDTATPDAAATDATVRAWLARSGPSAPHVHLTTSLLATAPSRLVVQHGDVGDQRDVVVHGLGGALHVPGPDRLGDAPVPGE